MLPQDELNKAHASSENRHANDKLLKTAFAEFYLSLVMTQNYAKHNLLGFEKIMKKFDKNLSCKDGSRWQKENMATSDLKKAEDVDKMIVQVLGKTGSFGVMSCCLYRWRTCSSRSWRPGTGRKPWPDSRFHPWACPQILPSVSRCGS